MSGKDRDRLKVLHEVRKRHITQQQAGVELGISPRGVRALLKRMKLEGDRAVVHGLRGRPSNRKLPAWMKSRALMLFHQHQQAKQWHDYGPTLAAEELAAEHGLKIGKETLRKWLTEAGLWQVRRARVERVHTWRARRARWGELLQWDTSEHDWLEGRSRESLYLIAMIDDASSRVLARFVRHDSTEENLRLLRSYLEKYGRPLAFYTDKASLFQTAPKAAHHRDAPVAQPTQIGRALGELNIEWIAAHSPQAKGRIERFFGTAQDRLVKGLRKVRARTLQEANAYLEKIYLPTWHQRFICEPRQAGDAHRALDGKTDLDSVLSRVERRTVAQDYTVRWQAAAYQIRRPDISGGMRGAQVAIEQRLDGSVWMRWRERVVALQPCLAERPCPAPKPERQPQFTRSASEKARARERTKQARRQLNENYHRLRDRPIWQAMRDVPPQRQESL
ncbi:MAG: ISNCY family transposase [Candidatus Sulfotelmatobacter sp.]